MLQDHHFTNHLPHTSMNAGIAAFHYNILTLLPLEPIREKTCLYACWMIGSPTQYVRFTTCPHLPATTAATKLCINRRPTPVARQQWKAEPVLTVEQPCPITLIAFAHSNSDQYMRRSHKERLASQLHWNHTLTTAASSSPVNATTTTTLPSAGCASCQRAQQADTVCALHGTAPPNHGTHLNRTGMWRSKNNGA
jgi:hypothetical protein